MGDVRRAATASAAIALSIAAVAVIGFLSQNAWSPTALVHMERSDPMAKLALQADPAFRFVGEGAHYDGVYFYAIAQDPFARGESHSLIDFPAYRYGHAGYGWLAGVASGGRASAVPLALLVLSLAGVVVAAASASVLAAHFGWSPWVGGLAVALNPGLVYAVTADTSEAVGSAMLFLALAFWVKRRWGAAGVALVAACLVKEMLVAVPVGLFLWEGVEMLRGRSTPGFLKRALVLAAGPVILAGWFVYLRATFGHWPFSEAPGRTGFPVAGWVDSLRQAVGLAVGDPLSSQIGAVSVALLAAVGGALLVGLALSLRVRTPLDAVFVLLAAVASVLTWLQLLYPKDLLRVLVYPIVLLPMVFAAGFSRAAELRKLAEREPPGVGEG